MTRPTESQVLPPWTRELLAADGICPSCQSWQRICDHIEVRDAEGAGYRLLSYRVAEAVELTAADFEAKCSAIYRRLAADLLLSQGRPSEARHPIRLWNFIPGILSPLGDLKHRYMVFNAGRFDALSAWLGGEHGIDRHVATASGVGNPGRDLEIHCLASAVAGVPVENPRQISSYRYSRRYGPKPPCFARATRFQPPDSEPWLLVGGTASVVGEDSVHGASLGCQLRETLLNLAAVVHAGGGPAGAPDLSGEDLVGGLMQRYRHLRIYYVREEDRRVLGEQIGRRLGPDTQLEWVRADLCRPELLVEIEGVADLAREPQNRAIDPMARVAVS
jgi:chorismate lyase/3-hydroxybenzoate synthase